MIKNKNIMFIADGDKGWIGGLYYVKNIIYTLFYDKKIDSSTKVYIVTKEENCNMFKSFLKYKNVQIIIYQNNHFNNIIKTITSKILKKTLDIELFIKIIKLKIDYLYPIITFPYLFFKNKNVYWIPDFQHVHLPDMFSQYELNKRNKTYRNIAENHKKLILSSKDAYNDYKTLYPRYTDGVSVLNFKSYINDDIEDINDEFIKQTKEKYNLKNEFFFLPNQFWKHKNHLTAFKAVNYILNEKRKSVYLVCTGNTADYRNKDHFSNLEKYIIENKLGNNILILGFISRKEQLALMLASKAVVQPSLFEGWGTVVEDAKALDKTIIMSDISVHFEQKNSKCLLFEKNDYKELGEIMNSLISK